MNEVNISITDKYKILFKQIENLIVNDEPTISNLSNITAAIKQTFSKISWVGFYFALNDNLFLGPFQGGVACSKIKIGKGVCGTAAATMLSQVVPNVNQYQGHIACDIEANSEIVIPIVQNNNICAVLDLDSRELAAFNEIDKNWLEKICMLISEKLNFEILFSNSN